jgi:hypothetical protein
VDVEATGEDTVSLREILREGERLCVPSLSYRKRVDGVSTERR